MTAASDGLEGVVAAETVLSEVDGANGVLIVRGRSVDELAGRTTYEEMVACCSAGSTPTCPPISCRRPGAARAEVFAEVSALDTGLLDRTPIEAVRALTGPAGRRGRCPRSLSPARRPRRVHAPRWSARQAGEAPVAPDPSLRHAADILRMLRGVRRQRRRGGRPGHLSRHRRRPRPQRLDLRRPRGGLDPRRPDFGGAGRHQRAEGARSMVARRGRSSRCSTRSASPANARALNWKLRSTRGDRLMGFGHRIYRVRDPRADALKGADPPARRPLAAALPWPKPWRPAALAILRERKPNRSLETNVEFYTALLLEALAFPPDSFTCVFAHGARGGLARPCPRADRRRQARSRPAIGLCWAGGAPKAA